MSLFDINYESLSDTITLKELLPEYCFDQNDDTTDKFIAVFQEVFSQLLRDIEGLGKIIDVDKTEERFLDKLIANLGFDLKISLSVSRKRKLVKVIINVYKQKGTAIGIENVIRQFLGIDVKCFPFTEGWILSQSTLGESTFLNPAPENAAGFYTFDVIVETVLSLEEKRIIGELIKLMKPSHYHFRKLVENGEDAFVVSMTALVNKGSLLLARQQKIDGSWDMLMTDNEKFVVNEFNIENVGYHSIACLDAYRFNSELVTCLNAFKNGAKKLIKDASYNFAAVRPRELDITTLNRAESLQIENALAKRDNAVFNLNEFQKAIGFLNNYSATSIQISETTQAERNTVTVTTRMKFFYLYLVNAFGLGLGVYRYVRYIQDYIEISDTSTVSAMCKELNLRVSGLDFQNAFGQDKTIALASIIYGLQIQNLGSVYENAIQRAEIELETLWNVKERQYFSKKIGTGAVIEQSLIIDCLMSRGLYNRVKSLLTGLREKQSKCGLIHDFISLENKRLRDLATVVESASKAIKEIEEKRL